MLFQRYRQRYGGYIVHIGLVLLVLGVIASHYFQVQKEATLKAGQDMTIGAYRLTFLGSTDAIDPDNGNKEVFQSQLQIWRDGHLLGYVYPGRAIYKNYDNQPASIIPIETFGVTDLYIVLDNSDGLSQSSFHVFLNPLVPFVWYGGLIMMLGGIICWWPERRRKTVGIRAGTVGIVPSASGARHRVGARHDPYNADPAPSADPVPEGEVQV
jgi:cytochrome c-type biogenesis protein CcmF